MFRAAWLLNIDRCLVQTFDLTPLWKPSQSYWTLFLKNKEMKFIFYFRLGSFFLLTELGLISVKCSFLLSLDRLSLSDKLCTQDSSDDTIFCQFPKLERREQQEILEKVCGQFRSHLVQCPVVQ